MTLLRNLIKYLVAKIVEKIAWIKAEEIQIWAKWQKTLLLAKLASSQVKKVLK